MQRFDSVVVAARFQPAHAGHFKALQQALELAPEAILLCLGADSSVSLNAPWTTAERAQQLQAMAAADRRVSVRYAADIPYASSRWRQALENAAGGAGQSPARVGLISDLTLGEAWPQIWQRHSPAAVLDPSEGELREHLLWHARPRWAAVDALLTATQRTAMRAYCRSTTAATLREEAKFIRQFRTSWGSAPYPPVFVTVDGVITWRDKVLLIRRGRLPGKDLWALPGGFVEPSETLAAGVLREVYEETGLALERSEYRATRVFDAPQRSLRGRTITHAFHYQLDARAALPVVRGGDDAATAEWFDRAAVSPTLLFDDHYAILQVMLGLE